MDGDLRLPNREGLVSIEPAEAKGPPARPLARPLWQLRQTHTVFNHGLLFIAGGLGVDPVPDYWARNDLPADAAPAVFRTRDRLFTGLPRAAGADEWARSLLVVSNEFWPGLFDHMRSIAGVDRARRVYWQVLFQGLPLVDPSDPGSGRAIQVVLLGTAGNDGRWGVPRETATSRPRRTWRVRQGPPSEEAARVGEAIFADSHQPLRAIEPRSYDVEPPRLDFTEPA